jgi:hypothetical protein
MGPQSFVGAWCISPDETGAVVDFRVTRASAADHPDLKVVEGIWTELNTPHEPDPRLRELTPGQRAVYALKWLEAEVCNGGFAQYFTNSTGFLWPESLDGADLLGLPELSEVLRGAAAPLGMPYPRDRDLRETIFDLLPETYDEYWDPFDAAFYDLMGPMTASMLSYIERHPEEFYVDP